MRSVVVLAILTVVLTACGSGAGAPAQPAPQAAAPVQKPAEKAAVPAPAKPAQPAEKTAAPAAAKPAQPAAAPAKPAAGDFVLRLGWATGDKGMQGLTAHAFKSEVEKTSNGRIKVELFCCAQLGGEIEQVNAVKAGRLDMHSGAASTVGSVAPSALLSLLPFFYADRPTAWKVFEGEAGQMVLNTLERQGLKGLAWSHLGMYGLLNHRKPVNTVDDLKGMKVRVVETPIFVSTWRALGATPVPMAWPEVYTGLQQKTVDGVDTAYQAMTDAKLYEVTKYLALTSHAYAGGILIMNPAKFTALPGDLKKSVEDAAKVAGEESRKASQQADEMSIETIKKAGLPVTTPPRDALQTATKSVYDEFVPKIGEDIVAKARATMGGR